jgi:hypothetical protein
MYLKHDICTNVTVVYIENIFYYTHIINVSLCEKSGCLNYKYDVYYRSEYYILNKHIKCFILDCTCNLYFTYFLFNENMKMS